MDEEEEEEGEYDSKTSREYKETSPAVMVTTETLTEVIKRSSLSNSEKNDSEELDALSDATNSLQITLAKDNNSIKDIPSSMVGRIGTTRRTVVSVGLEAYKLLSSVTSVSEAVPRFFVDSHISGVQASSSVLSFLRKDLCMRVEYKDETGIVFRGIANKEIVTCRDVQIIFEKTRETRMVFFPTDSTETCEAVSFYSLNKSVGLSFICATGSGSGNFMVHNHAIDVTGLPTSLSLKYSYSKPNVTPRIFDKGGKISLYSGESSSSSSSPSSSSSKDKDRRNERSHTPSSSRRNRSDARAVESSSHRSNRDRISSSSAKDNGKRKRDEHFEDNRRPHRSTTPSSSSSRNGRDRERDRNHEPTSDRTQERGRSRVRSTSQQRSSSSSRNWRDDSASRSRSRSRSSSRGRGQIAPRHGEVLEDFYRARKHLRVELTSQQLVEIAGFCAKFAVGQVAAFTTGDEYEFKTGR